MRACVRACVRDIYIKHKTSDTITRRFIAYQRLSLAVLQDGLCFSLIKIITLAVDWARKIDIHSIVVVAAAADAAAAVHAAAVSISR